MGLKTFKPYTKSTRGTILIDKTGIWKGKPFKPLTSVNNSSKVEITSVELHLEIMAEVTNRSIERLIFIEENLMP